MKKLTAKAPVAKKAKKNWSEIFINVFAIVLLGGAFVWMSIAIYNEPTSEKEFSEQYIASLPGLGDTIPHSKVCMVDDIFQGDFPSIPVLIDSYTYYACSQKATRDLITLDSLRLAIDPMSKLKVNKAAAIIAIHPDRDGKVMYFGSKDMYNKYLGVLNRQNKKR